MAGLHFIVLITTDGFEQTHKIMHINYNFY